MTTPQQTKQKRRTRWPKWLAIICLLLCVCTVVAWLIVKSIVANKIESQLSDLGFGKPSIDQVAVGTDGVAAKGISFFRENENQPWVTIDTLAIEHPLSGLAAGDEVYNGLTIDGVEAALDLAGSEEPFDLTAIDLTGIELPAKQIKLTNASIAIRQPAKTGADVDADEPTFDDQTNPPLQTIDRINATVKTSGDGIVLIDGEIGDLVGGRWNISGQLAQDRKQWNASLESQRIKLVDGQWQALPGMPGGVAKYLQADVQASAKIELSSNQNGSFDYIATTKIFEAQLNLPTFQLPIKITSGTIRASDGEVQYQNLVASTDGHDSIEGSGSTTIDSFPIKSNFEAKFNGLDVVTLRKLSPAIPAEVAGNASGNAQGSIEIEPSLRTTLTIQSQAQSSTAKYGSMAAKSSTIDVQIAPLIFDGLQKFESLDGLITVNATAEQLDADRIFESLDLNELDQQLEIEAVATGDFQLEIPLASADKIETWKMQVSGISPSGTIGRQTFRDVRVKANLAAGTLDFTEIVATPVLKGVSIPRDAQVSGQAPASALVVSAKPTASVVRARVRWPLSSVASPSDVGELNFEGQHVPAAWAIGLVNRQIQNATGSEVDLLADSAQQLAGFTSFQTTLNVDANKPDDLTFWSGDGSIRDSTIVAAEQQLNDLKTSLKIADGRLTFSGLEGIFDSGGSVAANGSFDLTTGQFTAADLKTNEMPLGWIASVAAQSVPSIRVALKNVGIAEPDVQKQLAGNLSAEFKLIPSNEKDSPLSISTNITAKRLTLKGQALSNLRLAGNIDTKAIVIERAHVDLANRGRLDLTGNWSLDNGAGSANLDWKRLPIPWLAGLGGIENDLITGTTSGEVKIANTPAPDASEIVGQTFEGVIPISVAGQVRATGLELGGLKPQQLGFDIRTLENEIVFDQFRSAGDLKAVDLVGKIKLQPPFAYSLNAAVDRLPFTKIFSRPSVIEKEKAIAVAGIASGKFSLAGDISSQKLNSNGKLKVSEFSLDNRRLSDVSAAWNYLGNDWKKSSVELFALGGTLSVTEFNQLPQRIKFDLKKVDASQLSSFARLPAKLTGKISGNASLNNWSVEETRWADLKLQGASFVAGDVEFGDLVADAEFRDGKLSYAVAGRLLNGKFTADGSALIDRLTAETTLPLKVQFTNGELSGLYRSKARLSSLRSLQGSLAANANLLIRLDRPPTGTGVVRVSDLTWKNERLTRQVSTNVKLTNGIVKLDNVRADLNRGEISGRASIPLSLQSSGTYELNVRSFDLQRFLEIVMSDPVDGVGLVDARISGRTGKVISGQGSVSINRAKVLGLRGRSLRVPIQFQYQPLQQAGRIELRQSRFQVFNGKVTGNASLDIGRTTNVKSDLKISNLDTDALFSSLAGLKQSGQGRLSGRLKLNGKSIRSARDLTGSFRGSLSRAEAFELPLLNTVGRFLGGNQLQSRDFESKDIDLQLAKGKVEVRQLNISNSLAQISISGDAYVDGRLDLDVTGRVEQLNQPTLLEQLLGSPLSRFRGSPVAVFAQAADFLSERLVFVKISGTFQRPLVRPNAGKQIQEETIRYFLRGSQILPNADGQNN
jgi:hypothetical protein